MKKIYLSLFMVLALFMGSFAQVISDSDDDLDNDDFDEPIENKDPNAILPQAGDIAIGVDMVPFMNYIGNMFNGNVNNNNFGGTFLSGPQTVFLKYFIEDEAAVRVRFKTEFHKDYDDFYVRDDAAFHIDPLSEEQVVDRRVNSFSSYGLGLGYEMHRGYNKLRGVYGAEFNFDYTLNNFDFEYGNTMTAANNAPTTSDFAGNSNQLSTRALNVTNPFGNAELGFGAAVFIGVEYFFAPKISIGSELSWGTHFTKSFQASTETEYWNGTQVNTQVILDSPEEPGFHLGMANPSVNLYMMFHF